MNDVADEDGAVLPIVGVSICPTRYKCRVRGDEAYAGWIGGLAVAVGIGAVLFTNQGIAWLTRRVRRLGT
jgi:hypothetical protein